ncbi:MAG: adenylate/guanylate cyclase domain-containing protein [bacterium]|nr:adenylate/guanylate cyclase domain-containing protein [bacterium]
MQGMLRRLRSQPRFFLGLLIFFLFLLNAVWQLGALDGLERKAYDMRVRATVPNTVDERIVIADIDEKSLKALGRWPWSRDVMARLVDTLFSHYQIRVAGFDVVFAEPEKNSGLALMNELARGPLKNDGGFLAEYQKRSNSLDNDALFARALAGRNVVLGMVFSAGNGTDTNTAPAPFATLTAAGASALPDLPHPRSYTANLDAFSRNAASSGFFDNPQIDADGIFRRVPLFQLYQNRLYPSLALATVHMALGAPQVQLHKGRSGDYEAFEGITLGDVSVPTDAHSSVLVPWRGRHGDSFNYYSISDILEKKIPLETLKNRIVLVGTTAPGLLDLRSTPLEKTYPGVEVHANIISGILDDMVRQEPAWGVGMEILMLLAVTLITLLLTTRLAPHWQVVITLLLAGGIIGINFLAWNRGLVMPLASPLLLLLILFTYTMAFGFFVETQGKRAITRLFGQYVPPDLVDEMAKHPEAISLEGESREMTVLFSDVRDFTSISEGLSATELSALMNVYLTAMTRLIQKHRGTIDKYIGDAIMAFWGAPLRDADHTRLALLTAMDMEAELLALAQEFRARGWPVLKIGIGLNAGTMNVGNMGSEFRMAYTVMGDAVNLGARLESLSKNYGVTIVVSESVRSAVPDFAYRSLDCVRVKGKQEPVRIYEPLGLQDALSTASREQLARWESAISAYCQQHWDEAENALRALVNSDDHPLYRLYLERIAQFRETPPPADWDGVYTYTSK